MSNSLGSVASLSRSAGGLAAGLQERNRYWIMLLERKKVELEGKMRASGDIVPAEHSAPQAAAPTDAPTAEGTAGSPAVEAAAATTAAGDWGWNGFANGTGHSHSEDEVAG